MTESAATIPIVEDEPITRSQLAAHFEREGYSVFTADSAEGVLYVVSPYGTTGNKF